MHRDVDPPDAGGSVPYGIRLLGELCIAVESCLKHPGGFEEMSLKEVAVGISGNDLDNGRQQPESGVRVSVAFTWFEEQLLAENAADCFPSVDVR